MGGYFLMLFVNTFFTPNFGLFHQHKNHTISIAIDVLRASTTICYALQNGAKEIVPLVDPTEAVFFANETGGLLAGEHKNQKIDGFQFGNSPAEFTRESVLNQTIAFCSTNGTKLFKNCNGFFRSFVAGFVNSSAVVSKIIEVIKQETVNHLLIACAGDEGDFSLEDSLCAGKIIWEFSKVIPNLILNDASLLIKSFFDKFQENIKEILFKGKHCKELIKMGFENDVYLAFTFDCLTIVPQIVDFRIKLIE